MKLSLTMLSKRGMFNSLHVDSILAETGNVQILSVEIFYVKGHYNDTSQNVCPCLHQINKI